MLACLGTIAGCGLLARVDDSSIPKDSVDASADVVAIDADSGSDLPEPARRRLNRPLRV